MDALTRFLKNWLLFAVLLAIWSLCLGAMSYGFILAFQVPPQIAEYGRAQNASANKTEQDAATETIAEGTVVLALFTGVLAVASIIQGIFINKQIKLARDEFNSTHRPRIRVKHLWLNEPIEIGKNIRINIVIVNSGDTVATDIHGRIAISVLTSIDYLPAKPNFANGVSFGVEPNAIRSGLTIEFDKIDMATMLTGEHISKIGASMMDLFCFGDIEYLDSDRRVRKTAFCRELRLLVDGGARFRRPEKKNPDYEYQD